MKTNDGERKKFTPGAKHVCERRGKRKPPAMRRNQGLQHRMFDRKL